jgi:hypothetical protein
MRFDLDAYQDTLRLYRNALDIASTAIDASTPQAEVRKSRLGQLRADAKVLAKEMGRTRKRMKKASLPVPEMAQTCGRHFRRVYVLREGLSREGVRVAP